MRFVAVFLAICSVSWSSGAYGEELDLDGDTDRTGTIEGSDTEENLEGTSPVLIICNCDRDNSSPAVGNRRPDNFDDKINGNSDKLDIEPIVLRKQTLPVGTSVTLKVS